MYIGLLLPIVAGFNKKKFSLDHNICVVIIYLRDHGNVEHFSLSVGKNSRPSQDMLVLSRRTRRRGWKISLR